MMIARCSLLVRVSISFCTARVPCVLSATDTSSARSATFFSTCGAGAGGEGVAGGREGWGGGAGVNAGQPAELPSAGTARKRHTSSRCSSLQRSSSFCTR